MNGIIVALIGLAGSRLGSILSVIPAAGGGCTIKQHDRKGVHHEQRD